MENIIFKPTEDDLRRVKLITDFFDEEGIPYTPHNEVFGIFYLNEGKLEVRYVNSMFYRIDNSKRFGEEFNGISKDYCINVSHENFENGIRTFWIFDFEMDQVNEPYEYEGEKMEGFHRQWEVIKNTLRTACGKIRYRFYARDCEVKLVDNAELRPFLNTNCFYGYRSANKNLGLYLKKDKNGLKKGTLLFVYTFGCNFYGNKNNQEHPKIEIIRASTRLYCQVIGGISKCIKHFCENYPTITVNDREVAVEQLIFYCDGSHNDSRGMTNANSFFRFVSWEGGGFINMFTDDVDKDGLKGVKGEVFMRRPLMHKQIMEAIGEGKIVSVPNAGTIVFEMKRSEFMAAHGNKEEWENIDSKREALKAEIARLEEEKAKAEAKLQELNDFIDSHKAKVVPKKEETEEKPKRRRRKKGEEEPPSEEVKPETTEDKVEKPKRKRKKVEEDNKQE